MSIVYDTVTFVRFLNSDVVESSTAQGACGDYIYC